MNHLYQVTKHIFTLATRKLESSKVGKPMKRIAAQNMCDKYNEEESRWNLNQTPESHLNVVSYTCVLVKAPVAQETA